MSDLMKGIWAIIGIGAAALIPLTNTAFAQAEGVCAALFNRFVELFGIVRALELIALIPGCN